MISYEMNKHKIQRYYIAVYLSFSVPQTSVHGKSPSMYDDVALWTSSTEIYKIDLWQTQFKLLSWLIFVLRNNLWSCHQDPQKVVFEFIGWKHIRTLLFYTASSAVHLNIKQWNMQLKYNFIYLKKSNMAGRLV